MLRSSAGQAQKGPKSPKGPTFGGPSAGGGSSAGGRFAETKKLPKGEQESKALWLPPFRPDRNVQRWLYDRTPMNIRQWAARGRRNLRHTARCEVAAAALTQALIQANTSNQIKQTRRISVVWRALACVASQCNTGTSYPTQLPVGTNSGRRDCHFLCWFFSCSANWSAFNFHFSSIIDICSLFWNLAIF